MFDVFKYDSFTSDETLKKWKVAPSSLKASAGHKEIELVGYKQTPCFRMTLVEVNNEVEIQGDRVFSGLYILTGNATVITGEDHQNVKKGDQLFIPAQVSSFSMKNNGDQAVKA